MSTNDDEVFDPAEQECPGPADLESALLTETLNSVTTQPPLVVDAGATLAETIDRMRDGSRGCVLVSDRIGTVTLLRTGRWGEEYLLARKHAEGCFAGVRPTADRRAALKTPGKKIKVA